MSPLPPPPTLSSLRGRRNVTVVSNVCEAAPRSSFWVPNGLNEFPEVCFEFPFILTGKSTMAFLTGQSNFGTQVVLKQGLRRCFADGLWRSLQTPTPPSPPPPPRRLRTFTNGCLHHFLLVRTLFLHNVRFFV